MNKIIDCHVHMGRVAAWDLELDYSALTDHLQENSVVQVLIFPIISQFQTDPALNDPLFEVMARDPRFILFPWINASSRDPKEIEAAIAYLDARKHLIRGLKYHPSISQVGFDDPLLTPLLEYANQQEWPWIIHSGRSDISDAYRVHVRALEFPRSHFIIAHLGGGVYDKIMESIHFYKAQGMPDNISFDSSQTTHSILVKRFLEAFGADKLIFGSDLPFLDFSLVLQTILSNKLSDDALERIFHRNIELLLR